ncbi:hypothetical protein PIB30_053166 [Stylosanthes scabra]|uniref:Uncharacterized protein n=1 Tax=Stylosanthes scabra TaxID=79078 RepID=A0ABU6UJX8_9FABA|nr:hypothetical protein [Stylosanthes scabra]
MSFDGDSLSLEGFESLVESAFKARIFHHLTSLQEITIFECFSAVSFPANCLPERLQKLQIKNCKKLASLSLDAFPNVKNLRLEHCLNLESISMSESPHTALQSLKIIGCHKLVSLSEEGQAAPNLTHLLINSCPKLEALPRNMDTLLPNLQFLEIEECGGICRFPEGGLPPNMETLCMSGYEEQLRDLSSNGKLEALKHLVINGRDCERVKSFPEVVDLLPHLPSLTTLCFEEFDDLETLECNQLLRLTSLQHLLILSCPKLKNIPGRSGRRGRRSGIGAEIWLHVFEKQRHLQKVGVALIIDKLLLLNEQFDEENKEREGDQHYYPSDAADGNSDYDLLSPLMWAHGNSMFNILV